MHTYSFLKSYKSLTEILTDHDLAQLGDAYINLAYSLAQSNTKNKPTGIKVKGNMLAQAIKKANLRQHLPSHMTRHRLADAAEALTVYAWLQNKITLEETVTTLQKTDDSIENFSLLLTKIKDRINLP